MKCNPTAFHYTEGAVELRRWFEKTESVFGISECAKGKKTEMKQLMTAEFCLIEEVQRMKHELWNLKVKEYNIMAYTQRFNELALMCPRMVKPKRVKVNDYIRGLTDNIKGEVTSSKLANLNEACTIKCHKCGKGGHKARYCKEKNVATGANDKGVSQLKDSQRGPEFTWEREDQIKKKYPHIFTSKDEARKADKSN
ncbi:putative reverse transcriptase domain-containing protein [Tanacetum coccineum]